MLSKWSEKTMRRVRWGLTIGWLVLILSMFLDPISSAWTVGNSPFAASAPNQCFQFQGECRPLVAYPMGARVFWGMVLPLVILTLFILGHEAWRRMCPLSFLSQIPRAMGWQQKRTIDEDSWLGRNSLYLQWSLLFLGLMLRLLLINSDRHLLGIFLLFTIASAIAIGFLFDGKTWCNYFCPMAPVQMIYSEPGGLLGSEAHTAPPRTTTQSMCRTVDRDGQEKSACVACKAGCMDIDAEGDYWSSIRKPDRKLVYYSYIGLVIGFYLYFGLYSGNWNFLSAGVWNETNQFSTLMNPGFFIAGRAIPIPKLVAVPLTLVLSAGTAYAIGLWIELRWKRSNKRQGYPLSSEQVQSRLFAIATFIAFNLLFFLGVRPTIGYLPSIAQQFLSWGAVVVSSLWLAKTWRRSAQRYSRERDASLLRRQLAKLNLDLTQPLEGRSLDHLNPDELYALAKVLPGFTQSYQLQIYEGVLRDAFEQHSVTPSTSLRAFAPLRKSLGISDEAHWSVLEMLQREEPTLFHLLQARHVDTTIRRPFNPDLKSAYPETTVYRSSPRSSSSRSSDHETVYRQRDPDATQIQFTSDEINEGDRASTSPQDELKDKPKNKE